MSSKKEQILKQMEMVTQQLVKAIENETGASFEGMVTSSGLSLFTQDEESVAYAVYRMSKAGMQDVRTDFDEEFEEFGIFGNFPK